MIYSDTHFICDFCGKDVNAIELMSSPETPEFSFRWWPDVRSPSPDESVTVCSPECAQNFRRIEKPQK